MGLRSLEHPLASRSVYPQIIWVLGCVFVGCMLWSLFGHSGPPGTVPHAWQSAARCGGSRGSGRLGTFDVRLDQADKPDSMAVLPVRPLTSRLEDFLEELRGVLDENQITQRPISYVLSSNTSLSMPLCEGQWLEFGVAGGQTVTWAAKYREAVCGAYSNNVIGFDTFTGLPEAWSGFGKGHFDRKGQLPRVPHNVRLVKGLFSESLPKFLKALDQSTHGRHDSIQNNVTFLHIDCDLYAGSRDALALLWSRIHPGCVLVFDDLLHYPGYRDHEIKSLWEFMHASHRRLQVIGIFGPLPEQMAAVNLNPKGDLGYFRQSVAFVVL